ncbi:MAG: HEAT repeat domain-containing protein, partial [Planctomycetota bacterium]
MATGLAAVMSVGCGGHLPLLAPAPQGRDGELSEREQRQLEVFDSTVQNPSPDIDAATRRQAAQELIAMEVPQATERLAEALRSSQPTVVLAVIEAMENAPEPVPGLLPAAVETLEDASGENLEKLALVLPRYGYKALDRIGQRALDPEAPPEKRLGPIYALAAFRSKESVERLMVLLDAANPAPAEVVEATARSLERLTGLPYGSDAEQWRLWWQELRDKPIEEWLRIVVQHLSDQNTDLQHQLQDLQRELDEMADEVAGARRDHFRTLPVEEQLQQLPEYLGSELAAVREFAIGQVERILRDSVRVPEPVQERLVERLDDKNEVPALRLSAARLLNDLNHPKTAEKIAAVLPQVDDVEIARGYLELLVKRPTREGLNPVLQWLEDPTAGPAAADALWAVISREIIDRELLDQLRPPARTAFETQGTPAHARLLAAIGDVQDRARVEGLLDAPETRMRRAVAEGLARAGARETLLRHVDDDVVYPYVVRVLERGEASVANMRILAELAPPPEHQNAWSQAISGLATRMDPSDLLDADEILEPQAHVPLALRASVLTRVMDLPADALEPAARNALLARFAEVQLLLEAYELAFEATQRFAGALGPAQAALKFRVAVLAGHYEDALALDASPSAWVDLFTSIVD